MNNFVHKNKSQNTASNAATANRTSQQKKDSVLFKSWNLRFGTWNLARGFTLIELLITIAIFSVLATTVIMIINPREQLGKANDAKRKNDLVQIQKALEVYYQDNDQYPLSVNNEIEDVTWGDPWQPYFGVLPKDPDDARHYVYLSEDGQSYQIYTSLERGANDLQAREVCGADGVCEEAPVDACGVGLSCNYGVSSPNITP